MAEGGGVRTYAIYERPRDRPNDYVVREWLIVGGSLQPGNAQTAPTLEAARSLLPPGAIQIGGQNPQDPTIIEEWMVSRESDVR